ncbi:hypothetical protein OUZ56_016203 [Daphnia magna]|uniref:Peptidase aspartic putative domain-containing protein n=1 Tax=Daphnia magna TaxID=35525 RepID=A0ABR0AQ31_9CRUS|nr:hypothetical protein OUZ56_016203 [Daphnia magna]
MENGKLKKKREGRRGDGHIGQGWSNTDLQHHIQKGYTYAIYNDANIHRQLKHKLNCFGSTLDPRFKKGCIKRSGIPETDIIAAVKLEIDILAHTRHNRQEFDLVIGFDYFWKIMIHQTKQGSDGSVACVRKLGWIIFGASEEKKESSVLLTTVKNSARPVVDFKEFWVLEHMGVTKEELEDQGFL